jgi:ABC-2 type transport system permease protein
MPEFVQNIMQAAPTTHFISASRAILYRGAGLKVVWQPFVLLLAIGLVFYTIALARFRTTINRLA